MPETRYVQGKRDCVVPGDYCYACSRRAADTPVPADYCWHHAETGTRYPLCVTCTARWRSYRDPGRLHSIDR
jgi:hypothetical protein